MKPNFDRALLALERACKERDLRLEDYCLLLRIAEALGFASAGALAVSHRLTPAGMTDRLDKLERRGYIHRRAGAADRRRVYCHATAEGLELLRELKETTLTAYNGRFA